MKFFDSDQGFGFLIDKNNRWVELSLQIPWDEAEKAYAKKTLLQKEALKLEMLPFHSGSPWNP